MESIAACAFIRDVIQLPLHEINYPTHLSSATQVTYELSKNKHYIGIYIIQFMTPCINEKSRTEKWHRKFNDICVYIFHI